MWGCRYSMCCLIVVAFELLISGKVDAHGDPIDLAVNMATNRLEVNGVYGFGEFVDAGGTLFTDTPGVQVSQSSNGVAPGASLGYVVTQGLLFWDGFSVADTSATITVVPPVGASYIVSEETGLQTGVTWGVYDGAVGWHRDGDFLLTSGAAEGVYGLAVQFVAELHGPSEPVLVALVLGSWSETEIEEAIALLSAEIQPTANPDFNNDVLFNSLDLSLWTQGYGIGSLAGHGDGDADGNGAVEGVDFLAWQRAAAMTNSPAVNADVVPEPLAVQLALAGLLVSSCRRFCGRGSWGRRRC